MNADTKKIKTLPTFQLELNNKPNQNGKYSIFIRVTKDRKHKRMKTSYEASSPKDWNKKQGKFRASEPNYATWNSGLEDELNAIKTTYRDLKENQQSTSLESIKDAATKEVASNSFIEFFERKLADIYNEGRIRDWKKINGSLNKFKCYLQKRKLKDISFNEVNYELIVDFDKHLHLLHNERQPEKLLHQNSIMLVHRTMRRIINKAILHDLMSINPYSKFKIKEIKSSREKLTEEEISSIEELDIKKESMLWHARNMFLFSFFCAGIRVGDLLQLRWNNIEKNSDPKKWRVIYQMGKNGKFRNLPVILENITILKYYNTPDKQDSDYIFPFMDKNQPYAQALTQEERNTMPVELKKQLFNAISSKTSQYNNKLAELAKKAGAKKKLTSHIARHSFASVALARGIPPAVIKVLMAHENINTTQTYMGDIDTRIVDEAMFQIFGENTNKSKKEILIDKINKITNPKQIDALLASVEQL